MSHFGLGFMGGGNGNDTFTKILLHMDGANGGTSFPDTNAGGSARAWTSSSVTTSTAGPKFGTAAASFAAGYVATGASAGLEPGAADFTIDFWLSIATPGLDKAVCGYLGTSGTAGPFYVIRNSSNQLVVIVNTSAGSVSLPSASTFADGLYHHIAIVRSGSTLGLYKDGALDNTAAISGSCTTSSGTFRVGQNGDAALFNALSGLIDEFRYSIGIARWTANFTPPAAPYSL